MKRVLKSSLSILLAITIVFSSAYAGLSEIDFSEILTIRANAAYSGTCGENLTWTLDDNGTLTISGTGDMPDYSYTSAIPWYNVKWRIKNIVIDSGVTCIGAGAFSWCENFTSVTIPDSVTSIGYNAFEYCTSLTSVDIPDSVISIGYTAFYKCTSLTSVEIPNSVTSIGIGVFIDCTKLTAIDLNNDYYTSIDGVLFNKGITELICYPAGKQGSTYTIPDSVTTILIHSFRSCSNLISITIPDSVTTIDKYAFYNCTNLTSVTIPDSVTSIGEFAFRWCESLTSITISNKLLSIGDSAFCDCKSLTSIIFPDSLTSMGNSVFSGCTSLTSIRLPRNIGNIGYSFFYNCTSLTSIEIPDSVTSIDDSAFKNCTSLTSITIPSNVWNIGAGAFKGCKSLSSITFPDSVEYICESAFYGCTNLISITIPDNVLIGTSVFYNTGYYNDSSNWENDILYIDNYLITAKTSITGDCIIKNGTKSIVCFAFNNCTNITSITIPEGVTSIGGYAFRYCENLISITIPNSVTSIESFATQYCTNLEKIITPCRSYASTCYSESLLILTHTYLNGWVIDENATCIEDGLKHATCSVCGETVTEVMLAPGHSYSDWIIDEYQTCTEDGSKHKTCSVCGETVTEVIPALGHNYSTYWIIDIEPTCTEDGSKSHHCTVCGDKSDVTVIVSFGHNFKVISTEEEHPHTISYKCPRCDSIKEEAPTYDSCVLCNFSYTNVDDETCKITGYLGNATSIVIPGKILGRTVVTTTNGAFKNNTTLISVTIEDGVLGLGAMAFLGCTSLSKIVIPESVSSIGSRAFYNCPSDLTIYCFRDSYAMQYAIDNNYNYVIMGIGETENCTIDYENKVICTTLKCSTSLDDIVYTPTTSTASVTVSLISGNKEYLGTGSIVIVTDNGVTTEYTLVVEGDTNGDSVCDVIDCAQVALVTNGHRTLDGAYAMAADSNSDDIVDINDYQSVMNKALAS